MKCPICHGTGIEKIYDKRTNAYLHIPCATCHKTGHINQTNEEWMKTLDTEELVDYLYEVHKGGASVERQAWIEKHKERIKMQIRGWLKEKHEE